MINAGKYDKIIKFYQNTEKEAKDKDGFQLKKEKLIYTAYVHVKTTKGYTLVKNDSDFEKATTNFTIRYPQKTIITRDMIIVFNNKRYSIEYLNNIDEANVELEIQAKVIVK